VADFTLLPVFLRTATDRFMTSAPMLAFRIGLGYDSHRLGQGGPLRIGGVDVPGEFHAIGHSDADVLLHAVTDALLGAIAGPDIGRLFPDDAEENRDRDSRDFVLEAFRQVQTAGYAINNLDAVILAQRPKMAPHIDSMRHTVAEMLQTSIEQVGLKAKTGEGVDAVGRSEAIAARVTVMLQRV
jgi:2-C-methyl-D-erythritol 2,4-cyclodiphosphate synthase